MTFFRSISQKVGLVILTAAFVPIASLLLVSYYQMRQTLAESVQEELLSDARIIASRIRSRIEMAQEALRVLAESPVIRNASHLSREKVETEMAWLQSSLRLFDDITVIGANGTVLGSTTYTYEGEWIGSSWYNQALKGKEVLSRAHLLSDQKVSVTEICIPVDVGYRAVLCGRIPIQEHGGRGMASAFNFGSDVLNTPLKSGETAFMVNTNGRILIHSEISRLLESLPAGDPLFKLLAKGGGSQWIKGADGNFLALTIVEDHKYLMTEKWAVVVTMPESAALAPLFSLHRGIKLAVALAFALALLLSVSFSRRLTERIRVLAKATDALAGGDLTIRTAETGRDELTILSHHFNKMATDLSLTMSQLRDSEQRFRALVEAVGEGIWALDQDGIVIHANPALERMLGISGVMGGRVDSYLSIVEPSHAGYHNLVDPLFPTQEMHWRTFAGTDLWVIYTARRLENVGQRQWTTFAVITDITERKNMEQQLARYSQNLERMVAERTGQLAEQSQRLTDALAKVEQADKSKGVFISRMSHELRTPLNSIIGFATLIVEGMHGSLPTDVVREVKVIKSAGEYLLALINDILDVSKIQAGMFDLEVAEVEAAVVAAKAFESIQGMLTRRHNLQFYSELPARGLWVRADPIRLQQIFFNLLGNAIKYTEAGIVRLYAQRENEFWRFTVEDTGIGIPPKELENIFNEFHQVKGHKKEGSGLGLALVRLLTEKMGGQAAVESTAGVGSKFSFTIPAAPEPEKTENQKALAEKAEPPLNVVIVLSEEAAGKALAELLSPDQAVCTVLSHPAQLRSTVEKSAPNLILLDPFDHRVDLLNLLYDLQINHNLLDLKIAPAFLDAAGRTGCVLSAANLLFSPLEAEKLRQHPVMKFAKHRRVLLFAELNEYVHQINNLLNEEAVETIKVYTRVDALELLENVHFDSVIIDAAMPDGAGLTLLRGYHKHNIPTPPILLFPHELPEDLRHALAQRVRVILSKEQITKPVLVGALGLKHR